MLNTDTLTNLGQIACSAAETAGELIIEHLDNKQQINHKANQSSLASQVVTDVDYAAQACIMEILQPSVEQYDLAMLGEESVDDKQRLHKPAFWCIDPLDGTLAFIRRQTGFNVSVGLVSRDGTPLIGVVYDPLHKRLFSSVKDQGILKNQQIFKPAKADKNQALVLLCDLSFTDHPLYRPTEDAFYELAAQLGFIDAQLRLQIGAVHNACQVLENPNCVYFKYPRQGEHGGSLWDYAATTCLFHEAGAIVCDSYGNALELNRRESTYMNHRGILYAADQTIAAAMISLFENMKQP